MNDNKTDRVITRLVLGICLVALALSLALASKAEAALAQTTSAAQSGHVTTPYGGWREMLQPGNARPCKQEDSRLCVWDARHMGNGRGQSYATDARGTVHPISHRTAHRALNG